jgi:hypothetical protein
VVLDTSRWDRTIERLIEQGVLTKADFDFVQRMWDLNAQLKPLAQKVNHEIAGAYFKEIEAQPFTNKFGSYAGGYAPAPPDPLHPGNRGISQRVEGELLADLERDFRESMPGVNDSFTKDRTGATRPLLLDVRLQARHFDQVLRFIHLQPAVRDVMSVLRDPQVATYLNSVDPTAIDDMLIPWLKDTASNRMTKSHGNKLLDGAFAFLRRSTGLSFMFGSIRNALQQATGLSNTAVYTGWAPLRNAAPRVLGRMSETWKLATSESEFMKNRLESQLGQLADDIDLMLSPSKWEAVKRWTNRHGYFLQRFMQNRVDLITWVAARDKAIGEGKSNTDAAAEADSVVRLSQGSTSTVDVAAYERSTPFVRLFTQFSGYFNSVLNQVLTAPKDQKARVAMQALLVPALASAAITAVLSGGTEFDDEDEDGKQDEIAWWLASNVVKSTLSLLPGAGPAVAQILTSEKRSGDRVSLAPFMASVQALARLTVPIEDQGAYLLGGAETGGRFGGQQFRDLGSAISMFTGVPLTPVMKALAFMVDANGDGRNAPQPEGLLDWMIGLSGNWR